MKIKLSNREKSIILSYEEQLYRLSQTTLGQEYAKIMWKITELDVEAAKVESTKVIKSKEVIDTKGFKAKKSK